MSSLLNLLLEQRLLLALLGFALLLLVGSVALVLITELRARARRRQRQREREEREARLAEQEEARAVDEAVDDALATVVPVASALPVTDAVPAVEAPAAAAETPGTEGAAAVPADAAPATDAPPAGESAPKPKIAVNLFAGKPDEAKPPTVEQVKAEAPKPDASKGAGGGDGAFGELFSGVFDDEAAARMQMMLSGSEPVTMEALAELSQRVANSLNGADSTAEPAKDGDAQ